MRILILSFYYKPDLCAGSFRATALVNAILESSPASTRIEVLTTLPNRYSSFSATAAESEREHRLSIERIPLPNHKSGIFDQSRAFIEYAKQVRRFTADQTYDLIIATSSRLMTAALGAHVARRTQSPLYLDIRDIFVDTIKDILPSNVAKIAHPLFSNIERWTVRKARKINLVSEGFSGYFSNRYPEKEFSYFSNGIDDEFLKDTDRPSQRLPNQTLEVVYAGNIGEGQGLHHVVPELAKLLGENIRFTIVGDGGRKRELQEAIARSACRNVELRPPVGRDELLSIYKTADVLFLHLNAHDAFMKVLPSKIFEYAALGKPILAGAAGYPASFIREHVENSAVFAPCDIDAAASALHKLKFQDVKRTDFIRKFSRRKIMNNMALDILDIAARR